MKKLSVISIFSLAAFLIFYANAQAQTSLGNFANFSGVDHFSPDITSPIPFKWARGGAYGGYTQEFNWENFETSPGVYNTTKMDALKSVILNYQSKGITLLVTMLGAAPAFYGGGNNFSATYTPQWKNFCRWVVSNLSVAPYNIKIYQIWNEPAWIAWWNYSQNTADNLNNFMTVAYIPGASAVHEFSGCKVVYGGHPNCYNVNDLITALNSNPSAWTLTDFLDLHYFGVNDMDALYNAAQAAGIANPGIWQTEIGYASGGEPEFLPYTYPKIYYWALQRWINPDQFKVMWYAYGGPLDTEDLIDRCIAEGCFFSKTFKSKVIIVNSS
jgi:hypothetical protein